ncbi:MAG: carboxymuconolactone decarboxylase family protein [Chlamydiota bacterium]
MARIPPKPAHCYPWYLRIFFFFQKRKWGAVPMPLLLWGRAPTVMIAFLSMWKKLNRKRSPLPAELRALISLRVSQINTCTFCIDLNTALLLQQGACQERIGALSQYNCSPLFDEKEKTALLYTEQVTKEKSDVSEELFATLLTYFSEDAIVELTALIAFQTLSCKFNTALGA